MTRANRRTGADEEPAAPLGRLRRRPRTHPPEEAAPNSAGETPPSPKPPKPRSVQAAHRRMGGRRPCRRARRCRPADASPCRRSSSPRARCCRPCRSATASWWSSSATRSTGATSSSSGDRRRTSARRDADLVKRVIGLPGETISSVGNTVLIDGRPFKEPWLAAARRRVLGGGGEHPPHEDRRRRTTSSWATAVATRPTAGPGGPCRRRTSWARCS